MSLLLACTLMYIPVTSSFNSLLSPIQYAVRTGPSLSDSVGSGNRTCNAQNRHSKTLFRKSRRPDATAPQWCLMGSVHFNFLHGIENSNPDLPPLKGTTRSSSSSAMRKLLVVSSRQIKMSHRPRPNRPRLYRPRLYRPRLYRPRPYRPRLYRPRPNRPRLYRPRLYRPRWNAFSNGTEALVIAIPPGLPLVRHAELVFRSGQQAAVGCATLRATPSSCPSSALILWLDKFILVEF